MLTLLTAKILGLILTGMCLAIGFAQGHKIVAKIEEKKTQFMTWVKFKRTVRENKRIYAAKEAYAKSQITKNPNWQGTGSEFLRRLSDGHKPGFIPENWDHLRPQPQG